MNDSKKSFILYAENINQISLLSDEEAGKIFKAVLTYAGTGEITHFDDRLLQIIFTIFQSQIDRNSEKWEETRKKRAEAGKKGGKQNQANQANASFAKQIKQNQANQAVNVSVSDNVSVNVNDNIPPLSPLGGEGVCESEFETFWEAYPKKASRLNALKSWEKLNPDSKLIREISAALESQKKSEQWKKENGRFIPYAAKWLNERRWEDIPEPEPAAEEKGYSFDLGEIKKLANNFGGK